MDKYLTDLRLKRWLVPASLLLCINTAPALAETQLQDHADVQRVARDYVAANHPWQNLASKVTAGRLDTRTRLQRCDGALQAFLQGNRAIRHRTSIGVRCTGSQRWKIYIPVTVAAMAPVLVAAKPLPAGVPLGPEDVEQRQRDIASLGYGYIDSLNAQGGYRTRMSVAQGAVITPRMVESAVLIKKGQRIRLSRADGVVQISMAGEAVSTASLGDRIRVKNLNSGRIVEGRVAGAEIVEITH